MPFDEALQYLLSLGHETLAIKLGLRNTELLLQALNSPESSFPSVQIAGTNGKGSVAVVLESICRNAGIKTGLYTSPHLVSITERIKINGVEISKADFATYASLVREAAEKLRSEQQIEGLPTFFEQVTAISLLAFREAKIELAILETGLGGRLDSTTAAKARVAGITPIGFDHEEYLGNTLAQIAAEKAAIIRPGEKVVIGHQQKEAVEVIRKRCEALGVEASYHDWEAQSTEVSSDGRFCVDYKTPVGPYEKLWLGLRGRHQIENVGLAIRLAETLRRLGLSVPPAAIVQGVLAARHAGRLELVDNRQRYLLDGAHNVQGAEALRDYLLEFTRPPRTILFGAMGDKRIEEIAAILFPLANRLVLTEIANPRSARIERLETTAKNFLTNEKIHPFYSSREALAFARSVTTPEGLICITGSLYLIGETRPLVMMIND